MYIVVVYKKKDIYLSIKSIMVFKQLCFYSAFSIICFWHCKKPAQPLSTEKVKGRVRIRECNLINLYIPLFNTESVTIRALFNSTVISLRDTHYIYMLYVASIGMNGMPFCMATDFLSDVINISFVPSLRSNLGCLVTRPWSGALLDWA